MRYQMRLYRREDDKPICTSFEIYADNVEEARELAWDEYISNHGLLLKISEDDARYVPVENDEIHGWKQPFQFALLNEDGNFAELDRITVWSSDEGFAREQAWDEIEYLLYADPEHEKSRYINQKQERSDVR